MQSIYQISGGIGCDEHQLSVVRIWCAHVWHAITFIIPGDTVFQPRLLSIDTHLSKQSDVLFGNNLVLYVKSILG